VLYRHNRVARLDRVDRDMASALEQLCCDGTPTSSPAQDQRAAQYVRELRNAEFWLSCDCGGSTDAGDALMAPRMNARGTVTLVRLGRAAHIPQCPWFRLRKAGSIRVPGVGDVTSHAGNFLLLDGREGEELIPSPDVEYARVSVDGQTRFPRLGRLLLSALDAAGMNRISTGEFRCTRDSAIAADVPAFYQRIDAIGDWPVAGEITIGDVLGHSLRAVRSVAAMVKRVESTWPSTSRPQGMLIATVDEADTDKQVLRRSVGGEEVALNVRSRSRVFGSSVGPYWALVAIARAPGQKWLEPLVAYVHPLLATGLPIPVDSQVERDVLLVLLRQMLYWEKVGVPPISLRKPLVAETGSLGSACPDVELSIEGRGRVLIEIMGRMNDPDYVARKVGMHARMKALPDVAQLIVYDPASEDPQAFGRRMTGAIHRLAGTPPRQRVSVPEH
jgi:hypothetical protein